MNLPVTQIAKWSRVLLIDGDNTSPTQVECIASPVDTIIIVDNNAESRSRWEQLLKSHAGANYFGVDKMPQATDLALAFAAGELLARKPDTQALPWLICSHDRDFHTLAQCLALHGVEKCVQVFVQPTRVKHKPAGPKSASNTKRQPQAVPTPGEWLDGLIRAQGGYPFMLSKVPALVKQQASSHPEAQKTLLGEGKLSSKLKGLGFAGTSTCLTGFEP